MILHLGCGPNYKEDMFNIDIDTNVKTDWCGDANKMPSLDRSWDELVKIAESTNLDLSQKKLTDWTNKFDGVYSYHSLEHFDCLFTIVNELARVCKNGSIWDITTPYWSWPQNQGNPYHKINFSEHTFRFFDKENGIYKRGQTQNYSLREIQTVFDEQQINFKLKLIK